MKNSGICPKCNTDDLLIIEGTGGMGRGVALGHTVFGLVPVDRFVCSACGYSEQWFTEDVLAKIRKKCDK
jgi:predicted nucleic-acid-binding Zn-ribbon protein